MAESRGLPFGRPPSQPTSRQFVDDRARSQPAATGWIISTLSGELYRESAASILSANTLRFNRLHVPTEDYILTKAVARCTIANAGDHAYSALYQLDRTGSDILFRMIPGTNVAFDATNATRIAVRLKNPVRIYAGTRLFMGTNASATTPTWVVAQAHTANSELTRAISVVGTPAEVKLSDTTALGTATSLLIATYYSEEAGLVV